MAEFYSLAMEFTPESNKDLMKALLSNRCLAYLNLNKYKEALDDAEKCIKTKPQWFRVSRNTTIFMQDTCYSVLSEV